MEKMRISLVSGLRQPRYSLERFIIQGSRVLWWGSTVLQDHHSTTLRLMRLLNDVAAEERQETQMNNELPSLDGKLKGE